MQTDYPCPVCGCKVYLYPDCPGYPGGQSIMVCHPACGNANEFRCFQPACKWWYRIPNNRSDVTKMGIAPPWMAEALAKYDPGEEEDA